MPSQNEPPSRIRAIFIPKRWKDYDAGDLVYSVAEKPAKIIKSLIQIAIAIWALFELGRQFYWSQSHLSCTLNHFCYGIPKASDVLSLTGDALAAAAAVELVYTLFTRGPDEALDPLMLGLSAAALLSLGAVTGLDPKQGAALLLYALALGVLFLIRNYLAAEAEEEEPSSGSQPTNNKDDELPKK